MIDDYDDLDYLDTPCPRCGEFAVQSCKRGMK